MLEAKYEKRGAVLADELRASIAERRDGEGTTVGEIIAMFVNYARSSVAGAHILDMAIREFAEEDGLVKIDDKLVQHTKGGQKHKKFVNEQIELIHKVLAE